MKNDVDNIEMSENSRDMESTSITGVQKGTITIEAVSFTQSKFYITLQKQGAWNKVYILFIKSHNHESKRWLECEGYVKNKGMIKENQKNIHTN